jgi:hypothetical protein
MRSWVRSPHPAPDSWPLSWCDVSDGFTRSPCASGPTSTDVPLPVPQVTWKATGLPTVRQQRGRWVVRVDGIDAETPKRRPRQLGTYRASAPPALPRPERSSADGSASSESRSAISSGSGLTRGPTSARTARDDISAWLTKLAADGDLSRRSIQIIRMTLRPALAAAVDSGEVRRNVAARAPMRRDVADRRDRRRSTRGMIGCCAGPLLRRSPVPCATRGSRRSTPRRCSPGPRHRTRRAARHLLTLVYGLGDGEIRCLATDAA